MASGVARWAEALSALLPTGFAWPRDPRSVLMRVLWAWAALLDELNRYTRATVAEWMPHSTTLRLEEWEAACGLPDPCLGPDQTVEMRRNALLARLRQAAPAYDDSSAASPDALERFCLQMGFVVRVAYRVPFRCGRNRVGDRLGDLTGRLEVCVIGEATPFRVGINTVGQRLLSYPMDVSLLYCALKRVVPARFEIDLITDPSNH